MGPFSSAWTPRWGRGAPTAFEQALRFLRGRDKRKLGHNTYLEARILPRLPQESEVYVRYHRTNIVVYKPSGAVEVSLDGYNTPTTKARLKVMTPSTFYTVRGQLFVALGDPLTGKRAGRHRHDGLRMSDAAIFWPISDVGGKPGFFVATDESPPPWATLSNWYEPPPDFHKLTREQAAQALGLPLVRTSRG